MRRAFGLLALVELVSFGVFGFRAGFYHDDWAMLEVAARAGGYWDGVREFSRYISWSRPVEFLTFPLFYALGGLQPVAYQAALLLLDLTQGCLLFLLLDGLLGRRSLALAASAAFLLYPNHAVTHVWYANSPQSVALVAVLASLLAHQRWIKTRRTAWLWLGQLAYLAGCLCYESVVFLPLLLGAGLMGRRVGDGMPASRAAKETAWELAPFGLALLVVVLWQHVAVPRLLGFASPKKPALSLVHALSVFKAGFGCITYQTIRLCLRTAGPALRELPSGLIFLLVAFAAALATALIREDAREPGDGRKAGIVAAWLAAGGFAAANLPYALSQDYWPTYVGIMSRTSALGALPGGLLVAVGFVASRHAPRLRAVALAILAGAFTWCNWHTGSQWVLSWRLQQNILKLAARKTKDLPRSATVLLAGVPANINSSYNQVIVFDASWDISAALRLATGRTDLAANVVSPRLRFTDGGVHEEIPGVPHGPPDPYENLYLYRYDRDTLVRLDAPPSPAPAPNPDL